MTVMTNALVYVKNHKRLVQEEIDNALSQHYGVSNTRHALKGKGMVFVDYECDEVSMETILNDLKKDGLAARVIGL
ncbi:MAG: hypothetical protein OEM38_09900 [Gammaproteobacteria bacterium]|nr:hypothetical protein [Gammaproteobacteria bacterium]